MKNLTLLFIFAIFAIISHVCLSQNKKTYFVNTEGNVIETEKEIQKINLCFEDSTLKLTDKQVSQLLKDGKIKVSQEQIKGRYENFILFYVPRFEVVYAYLDGNMVRCTEPMVEDGNMIFAWWFLCAIICIFCEIFSYCAQNKFLAVSASIAILTLAVFAFMFGIVLFGTGFFLLFVALISFLRLTVINDAHTPDIIIKFLIPLIILGCVGFYFQV